MIRINGRRRRGKIYGDNSHVNNADGEVEMAAAKTLKQTRTQILLSLNAVAIVIAGVLIASAIWLPKKATFHVVSERSDDLSEMEGDAGLLDPVNDFLNMVTGNVTTSEADGSETEEKVAPVATNSSAGGEVANGELWSETSMTIYQSADKDICVSDSLSNLGDMYWQTSDPKIIAGFYSEARTKLGYDSEHCRFPKIVGTGTVTVTAGTYDGTRRDTLTVTVIAIPTEEWKRKVLALVNEERKKTGLGELTWGTTCENGAETRAKELLTKYDHTRPDGSSWQTACQIPATGGTAGENVAAGSSTSSPELVVAAWMASPTHKENILKKEFTKLSVGLVFDVNSQYKIYWSQYFSNY
ncbi:MAG: CAP domain-containing protein [Candidatus Saccharibacteria bacterium]|nr:CAP domain-containing protein [Candidatus Saccharibacteria bacterium]